MVSRAVLQHAADEHAIDVLQREGSHELRRELLRLDAEPAARDLPVADDLLEHGPGDRNRYRESYALRASARRKNHAVDADQIAARVDQCAARIAEIDRGIGLNEILEGVDAEMIAAECADDAVRDRVAKAERVAEGEHRIADLHTIERSKSDRGKTLAVGLEDGEIGLGIAAADSGTHAATVREHDLDVIGSLDHVIVGEDVAFVAHNHPGAKASRAPRFTTREPGKETTQHWVVSHGIARAHFLARVDVHDRRHRLPRRIGEALDLRAFNRRSRLLNQNYVLAGRDARKQIRPQRRDDEQSGKTDSGELREEQPEAAQQDKPRSLSNTVDYSRPTRQPPFAGNQPSRLFLWEFRAQDFRRARRIPYNL